MEPMSSIVHLYYDFKRRFTYIRVKKMLEKQKKNQKNCANEEQKETKIKKGRSELKESDENDITSKGNNL